MQGSADAIEQALAALGSGPGEPLRIGGRSAEELVAEHGSPLYVYDLRVFRERIAAVREALGPEVELFYSLKANPHPAVVAAAAAEGLGAEIASAGELQSARAAAAAPILFAGPGKTAAEMRLALQAGARFHLESEGEAMDLAALAEEAGTRAEVAVRVNPPSALGGSRLRMGGGSSVFGVDDEAVPDLLARIAGQPSLELVGLHVYGGTQCFRAPDWLAQARFLLEAATDWEARLGIRLPWLDLGGGFGVPVFRGDPEFDLGAAAAGLRALAAGESGKARRLALELGRYLVAPAGVYLARVVRTKTSRGRRFAVLEGGMNHCAFATGQGAVLKRPALLVHAGRPRVAKTQPVTVTGPLCTSLDSFGEVLLPPLAEGDLVAVLHAGAYGPTYSPTGFLGHPAPREIALGQSS